MKSSGGGLGGVVGIILGGLLAGPIIHGMNERLVVHSRGIDANHLSSPVRVSVLEALFFASLFRNKYTVRDALALLF